MLIARSEVNKFKSSVCVAALNVVKENFLTLICNMYFLKVDQK